MEGWRVEIVIVASKGKELFYEKLGFKVLSITGTTKCHFLGIRIWMYVSRLIIEACL